MGNFILQLKFGLQQFRKFIIFILYYGYEHTYGMNGIFQNAEFYCFKWRTVDAQFFDQVHHHHSYPFLNTSLIPVENSREPMEIVGIFEEENSLEDNDSHICKELYDQRNKGNLRWARSVEKNFKEIEKMLSEITLYKRRRTMPRTFKDHSNNTLFFN
ncbi:hypothetical protein GLOIN_2v1481686 [Rhizophagus clarus]|uniref:Uncharacterized protein n=2 Tax=Rhizophagus clarus TaxID=94130 RepID=A0A8H3LMX7_9GLOM|nr:hypothetical protein GLOIN_2v1481686 [Rhizophagus clarus]